MNGLKQALFECHRLLLRLKIAVYPVHYYSCAVDLIALEKNQALWVGPSSLPGLEIDLNAQIDCLRKICAPYEPEYRTNPFYRKAVELHYGPGFGYIEAQALHAVARHFRPRHMVEVGSGVSTYCAHEALKANAQGSLLCVEPNPSLRLEAFSGEQNNIELLKVPVQAVPLSTFEGLRESDILFIDSSHVVKAGSDVNYLVLEVLPRLQRGVLVHFHDICFPYDYQRDLLWTFLHNNETSLLRAFLCFNKRFKILFCLSHLHYERSDALKEIFPEYKPQSNQGGFRDRRQDPSRHFPSSVWLQVVS
jgi:predicted O-methyltransferase YrrM